MIPSSHDEPVIDPKQLDFVERMKFYCKQQPLVPAGVAATVAAVAMAGASVRTGDRATAQQWYRWRVMAQGFTVLALVVGGLVFRPATKEQRVEYEELARQKAKVREQMWIQELERRDAEDKARQWRAEQMAKVKDE